MQSGTVADCCQRRTDSVIGWAEAILGNLKQDLAHRFDVAFSAPLGTPLNTSFLKDRLIRQ